MPRRHRAVTWPSVGWRPALVVLVGLVLAVTLACSGEDDLTSTGGETLDTRIRIVGSDTFVAQVKAALFLLSDRAPETFAWVEGSIEDIFLTPFPSGTAQDVIEGKVRVAQDHAFAPGYNPFDQVVWLAGALVFEACVINLYRGGGDYSSDTAAVTCTKEQIFALRRLDRRDFLAGIVEDHLYGNFPHDLIDSVPDPDY